MARNNESQLQEQQSKTTTTKGTYARDPLPVKVQGVPVAIENDFKTPTQHGNPYPQGYAAYNVLGRNPQVLECPKCHETASTRVKTYPGIVTWGLVIGVGIIFWPLCWIPLCIDSVSDFQGGWRKGMTAQY